MRGDGAEFSLRGITETLRLWLSQGEDTYDPSRSSENDTDGPPCPEGGILWRRRKALLEYAERGDDTGRGGNRDGGGPS